MRWRIAHTISTGIVTRYQLRSGIRVRRYAALSVYPLFGVGEKALSLASEPARSKTVSTTAAFCAAVTTSRSAAEMRTFTACRTRHARKLCWSSKTVLWRQQPAKVQGCGGSYPATGKDRLRAGIVSDYPGLESALRKITARGARVFSPAGHNGKSFSILQVTIRLLTCRCSH